MRGAGLVEEKNVLTEIKSKIGGVFLSGGAKISLSSVPRTREG